MIGTYTTVQGDMWDSIAYKALGSTAYMDRLMTLNTEYIGYYTFPAGVVIELPEVDDVSVKGVVPPWKETVG